MAKLDDEDWFVCCSDEEKYTSTGCKKGKLEWTPKPEEIIRLFEAIDKGETEGNCLYLTEIPCIRINIREGTTSLRSNY